MVRIDDALIQRAHELGAFTEYRDVSGESQHARPESLAAVVDILAADEARQPDRQLPPIVLGRPGHLALGTLGDVHLVLADGAEVELSPADGHIAIPPDVPFGCHTLYGSVGGAVETSTLVVAPDRMPAHPELRGTASLFVPLYALWTDAEPLPSFDHLRRIAERLAVRRTRVLATLPLYATFLDDPFDPSPYAPVSRLHWNEVYLSDDGLPAAEIPSMGSITDWRVVSRRRRLQLLEAARRLDGATRAAIDEFVTTHPDVADYARFRSVSPSPIDREFPPGLVQASHALAQLLAHQQLSAIEGPGTAALALDLPIGASAAGYEPWAHGDRFAPASVGAPPDAFFADGQDWGFPPQLPVTSRATGHDLWRRMVARAGTYSSVLRIDHMLGFQRQWWIPRGAEPIEGVYVRYPREELLAVTAAEAAVTSTMIVGENLGTVPPEVTEALDRWGVVGMYAEQFNLFRDHLDPIPPGSWAAVRTHDMPAFAAAVTHERADPVGYAERLGAESGHHVDAEPGPLLAGALARLAGSDAFTTMVDLDDLYGETAPHNVPGWVLDTTWRRRLPVPYPDLLGDPVVQDRLHRHTSRPAPATSRPNARHAGG